MVNHFYRSENDDYRSGWVRYPLGRLEEGEHEITFKAWDIYNNSTEATLKFIVGSMNKLEIRKLMAFPNPFRETTALSFEHNRATDDLKVWAQLYSIRGELIRTLEIEVENSNSVVNLLNWDGAGASGKKLETGLYIFKVFIRSLKDGSENAMTTKITLIN
jgi:flagellar hook assembly protein FlgD